jgi:hypothetical protein
LLAALGSALNLITILWLKFNRQVQTKRGIIERTYNTDNALAQYHWFKERAEAIKADQEKIKITQGQVDVFETSAGERKTWTFEDKTEHARLQSVVSGIKSHYQDLVAEYNARAKEVDRAIFKDALPLFFSLEAF